MLRLFGTVFAGLGIGIVLVFGIGYIGVLGTGPSEPQSDSVAATPPKAVQDTDPDAPIVAERPPARLGLPIPFYLWRDGYTVGRNLDRWSNQNQEALAIYLSDWGLPAPELDSQGAPIVDPQLSARLMRRHPDTRPQWVATDRLDCEAWVAEPQPRMSVTWTGDCADGQAVGKGVLMIRFVFEGGAANALYQGTLVAGQAEGQGTAWTKNGYRYDGGHRAGLYDGDGILSWPDGQADVYEGTFKAGFPHGTGTRSGGRVKAKGTWRFGCFEKGGVRSWALRHPSECSARSAGPPNDVITDLAEQ